MYRVPAEAVDAWKDFKNLLMYSLEEEAEKYYGMTYRAISVPVETLYPGLDDGSVICHGEFLSTSEEPLVYFLGSNPGTLLSITISGKDGVCGYKIPELLENESEVLLVPGATFKVSKNKTGATRPWKK